MPWQSVYKIQHAVPLRVGLPIQNAVPLRAGLPIQNAAPLRVGLPIQYITMQYDTVQNAKTRNTTLR